MRSWQNSITQAWSRAATAANGASINQTVIFVLIFKSTAAVSGSGKNETQMGSKAPELFLGFCRQIVFSELTESRFSLEMIRKMKK